MKAKYIGCGVLLTTAAVLLHSSCATIPKGATAVSNFQAEKYLGKWYEIARMDFRFERNLNNTTAEYSFNADGSIKVVNKGYNYKSEEWKTAIGKAKFRGDKTQGKLKVSFWGPFYSGYNVLAIDPEYQYVLVAGKNLEYLWLMSRTTTIPENVKSEYLKLAQKIGYPTDALVWVKHD